MNILIYEALSQHNVLTEMSERLASALAERGAVIGWIASDSARSAETVSQAIAAAQADWVIGFASYGADLRTLDGRSVYDVAGCGFVGWDVDHPAYQFGRFSAPIARRIQINASPSHARFAQLMGCRAGELPMLPGAAAAAAEPLAIEDRPIPAAIAMTWLGEPDIWWADAKGTFVYTLVEGVVGRLLADPQADLFEAYQAVLAEIGMEPRFDASLSSILANIGLFVRRYDRLQVARTLVHLGLPCVICGSSWRERLGERPHITYLDNLEVSRLDQLYAQSRVVFNLNAANGGSERAIQAMAAGAVVVSDHGPLLQTQFEAQGGLRFFDRSKPQSIEAVLVSVLAAGEAQVIADRGRALIAQGHLWPHKAAALLSALGSSEGVRP